MKPQEFWAGSFGSDYTQRNQVASNGRQDFFKTILDLAPDIKTVCELGANRGHNLDAIHSLNPEITLTGVEINREACFSMGEHIRYRFHSSIEEFEPWGCYDLVFTCGVLIHIDPDNLQAVYKKLYDTSAQYILINEYFNPTPVEIPYRGHAGKLFKRDFVGGMLDRFPTLKVIEHGFLWQRTSPAWDNTTWALLSK